MRNRSKPCSITTLIYYYFPKVIEITFPAHDAVSVDANQFDQNSEQHNKA